MDAKSTACNPWIQWQQALVEEGCANLRRLARLPRLWEKAQELKKGATPSEVIYEQGQLKLLHYHGPTPSPHRVPLLFVFALVNRPYILDLKTGRSVVSHFVNQGFDTYLLDWGSPTRAELHLTLDHYVNGYMADVVNFIRQRTGAPRVSLFGYCMGGTMSAIFTALHPDSVQNLILLAAGIDFATCDGLLNLWTKPEYFDVDKFVDAYGNVPAEFLQSSFLLLKPVQNLIEKPINLFERLEDEEFVEDFLTMEMWLNDNIAVPGEVFREFVKNLYQQNLLTQNRLRVGQDTVDLRRITCPILNVIGRSDDLVPAAQSLPFNDLVGSADRKSIVFHSGHIGLAVGGKAQTQLWPQACQWLAQRSSGYQTSEPRLDRL
jgi:polyhydroxyalkanoate synthase